MKAVKFFVDLEDLAGTSGRYDNQPKQTRAEITVWIAAIFKFTEDERIKMLRTGTANVICSPESFCRFLVERCQRGHVNQIRRLRMEMIDYPMGCGPLTLVERL